MSAQPSLSREIVYVKLSQLNLDPQNLTVHQIAFIDTPGTSPEEEDWLTATVTEKDGTPALAVMVGPERGDSVSTNELEDADYQVWVDVSVDTTGERVVRPAGIHSINPLGVQGSLA